MKGDWHISKIHNEPRKCNAEIQCPLVHFASEEKAWEDFHAKNAGDMFAVISKNPNDELRDKVLYGGTAPLDASYHNEIETDGIKLEKRENEYDYDVYEGTSTTSGGYGRISLWKNNHGSDVNGTIEVDGEKTTVFQIDATNFSDDQRDSAFRYLVAEAKRLYPVIYDSNHPAYHKVRGLDRYDTPEAIGGIEMEQFPDSDKWGDDVELVSNDPLPSGGYIVVRKTNYGRGLRATIETPDGYADSTHIVGRHFTDENYRDDNIERGLFYSELNDAVNSL